MRNILTTLALLVGLGAYGQVQQIDNRLLARYTASELKSMQKNDPNQYQFLINALDRGVFIAEIPAEKAKDIVWDGVLNIDPKGTYTFISLGKKITNRYQRYKIEGTNMILSIYPKLYLEPKNSK